MVHLWIDWSAKETRENPCYIRPGDTQLLSAITDDVHLDHWIKVVG
jgi:hypothetical protein